MPRLLVDLREQRSIWTIPEWAIERILSALPSDWESVVTRAPADGRGDGGGGPSAEALEAIADAEIYLGYGFPEALFEAAHEVAEPKLRWVHSGTAGVGGTLHPAMRRSSVLLTNSAGIHAEPIAESVLGMILHFTRGMDVAVRAQSERRWLSEWWEAADTPVRELSELTVGILGLGGIGGAVARRMSALGARVIATRRSDREGPEGVELLAGPDALERLLACSDVLVVALPETADTHGLLTAERIALLPAGAILVNVARGGVIDEGALIEALGAGRIRGAALDVFSREPLPVDSPIWGLPNALVTPHVSGTSRLFWSRECALITENIRRYLSGEPMLNLVDKSAGY